MLGETNPKHGLQRTRMQQVTRHRTLKGKGVMGSIVPAGKGKVRGSHPCIPTPEMGMDTVESERAGSKGRETSTRPAQGQHKASTRPAQGQHSRMSKVGRTWMAMAARHQIPKFLTAARRLTHSDARRLGTMSSCTTDSGKGET
jgi:hypothetical protein